MVRVEAGKKLGAVSRNAKNKTKHVEKQRSDDEEPCSNMEYAGILVGVAGVIVGIASIFYSRRDFNDKPEDEEVQEESKTSEPPKQNSLDYFD